MDSTTETTTPTLRAGARTGPAADTAHGRDRGLAHALVAACVIAAALAGCRPEPAFVRSAEKASLVEALRQTLLSSVEAEKIAVLSTDEQDARQAADATRALTATADGLRTQLAALVAEDARPAEVEALERFDLRWKELKGIDALLLDLALTNTNLKAASLSARDGLTAIERFVEAIGTMQRATDDPATIRLLGDASAAALKEEVLLLIHVPAVNDAEMTQLEQRMAVPAKTVDTTLAALRAKPIAPSDALETASAAWTAFREIAVEVIRLSRENSDVRSFEVSVNEKRKATRECLDALATLLDAVDSAPHPAR